MKTNLNKIITYKLLITILNSFFILINLQGYAQPTLFGAATQGGNGLGVIYGLPTGYTSYTQQYNLQKSDKGKNPKYSKFIQVSNGKMYGMVSYGGANNYGAIFEYDPTTNIYTPKFDFSSETGINPTGALIKAINGKLYGLTNMGGTSNHGTLFEYDYLANVFTKKLDFDLSIGAGPIGTLFESSNNKLYGLTFKGGLNNMGVMFEYDITTDIYTKKIEFSGATNGKYPYGNVMQASNGKLYGMTNQGGINNKGVLFEYDLITDLYSKKLDFNGASNGGDPIGSLMQSSNTMLYGMTSTGGINNKGVLFEYDITTNIYTKKIDFNGTNYGSNPFGDVMEASNGKLYGVTNAGGIYGYGVLFEYVSSTNILTKKLDFNTEAEGRNPACTLFQAADNKLYGTTQIGGFGGPGVIFRYDITLNKYTKLINLNGASEGGTLTGTLIHASDNKLYGLTLAGGSHNLGVIYQYDYLTNVYTKKFEFDSLDGYSLWGSLLQASNGKLYGLTSGGGVYKMGTMFEYDIFTNTFTKKIDFNGISNGLSPRCTLIQGMNGKLYGTTSGGGVNSAGVLFEYDIITDTYLKLSDFSLLNNGGQPNTLFQTSNGKLYGMTYQGGINDKGVIFEYDITTGSLIKKVDFDGINKGQHPYGTLIEPVTGKLYGMTLGGGSSSSYGALFEYDFINDVYTKKIAFAGSSNGSFPMNSLMKASNNKLYGTTSDGGSYDLGTVFEYDIPSSTLTKKLDLYNTTGCYAYFAGGYGDLVEATLPCSTPTIISQPFHPSVCNGSPASITIDDVGGTLYQWQVDYGSGFSNVSNIAPYSGVTTKTLSIASASPGMNGYRYRCIVSHHLSCFETSNTATLTVKMPIVNTTQTNISCYTGSNGSATITPVSGTSVYSYSWLPGGVATSSISNLSVGNYTCIITDTNSCSITKIISITQPSGITASINKNNVSCNGLSNGTATALAIGGNGPYTYSWSPITASTQSVSNLVAGNYSCTITDSKLCSITRTISITEPTLLSTSAITNSISCYGDTATASISAVGGTSPYIGIGNYTMSAGTNSYVVTDAKGCVATNTLILTQPPVLQTTILSSTIMCHGAAATLTVDAFGGTAPYSGTNTYTANAGTNTYVVIDANGCVATNSITITEPPILQAYISSSTIMCHGGIATLTISASGGIAPYTGINTYTMGAGTNSYSITDSNGCIATSSISLTEPNDISSSNSYTLCNGDSIMIGTSIYKNSGVFSDILQSLINGCDSTIITNLTINSLPTVFATSPSSVLCHGQTTTITANGAASYTWSNASTSPTITVSPTVTTNYTLTGTGANGCVNTAMSTIVVYNLPTVTASSTSSLLCTGQTATITAGGATSYLWNDNSTNVTISVSPTTSTTYSVTGTDINGCSDIAIITQSVSLCTGIESFQNNQSFISIYPNPTNGILNIDFDIDKDADIHVLNSLGEDVFQSTVHSKKTKLNLGNLNNGIYIIKIITNDKQLFQPIIITK